MLIELDVKTVDRIIQALVFEATVDVSGDTSPELQDSALTIAENLITQTGGENSPTMRVDENRTITFNDGLPLEDAHLEKRIRKILRV